MKKLQFDLVDFLHTYREFSRRVFGPRQRIAGVLDHVKKEIKEIEKNPDDPVEWIDMILLSYDALMRLGLSPTAITEAMNNKFRIISEERTYPDWRDVPEDQAIEHIRDT